MTKNKNRNLNKFLQKRLEEVDVPFFVESEFLGNHYFIMVKNPNFDEMPVIEGPSGNLIADRLNTTKLYFNENLEPFTKSEVTELRSKFRERSYRYNRTPVTDEKILAKFLLLGNSFNRKKQIISHLESIIIDIKNTSDVDYIESIYDKIKWKKFL